MSCCRLTGRDTGKQEHKDQKDLYKFTAAYALHHLLASELCDQAINR